MSVSAGDEVVADPGKRVDRASMLGFEVTPRLMAKLGICGLFFGFQGMGSIIGGFVYIALGIPAGSTSRECYLDTNDRRRIGSGIRSSFR